MGLVIPSGSTGPLPLQIWDGKGFVLSRWDAGLLSWWGSHQMYQRIFPIMKFKCLVYIRRRCWLYKRELQTTKINVAVNAATGTMARMCALMRKRLPLLLRFLTAHYFGLCCKGVHNTMCKMLMVSLYFRLFLLLLLLTAVGKFVARRPLVKAQAELYFGMCQGDVFPLLCCRCSVRAVWGVLGSRAPANSWISSDPNPCVCVRSCGVAFLLNYLAVMIRLSEDGKGLRKRPV